ncbi:MAG: DEAD/DEAH box helicase family protein, partial [Eubacterium sp.]
QPSSMEKVKLYGVELDILSGRIARQLYQQSRIAIKGFEQTDLPDSFFDAAIGNVPFGAFQVRDSRYDKQHFHIHDYFFAKTLDKIRPGGIIAFITSKGTMDKSNSSVRRYIAERANLIAAIRLPDNTFKASAGTEVTSDILFLQKRDRLVLEEPQWIALNRDEKGIVLNAYFTAHPEMILGEMVMVSGPFGEESHCKAIEGISLEEQLKNVIHYVQATIKGYEPGAADSLEDGEQGSIPADPSVRNFSYTLSDAQIYYRENSQMRRVVVSKTAENRIKGMITIREVTRTLIAIQTDDYPENAITAWQNKLNTVYDVYVKKYGHLTERGNRMAFSEDGSYPLLCSLEILDDEGRFVRKADMFSKRTIKVHTTITHVDTAQEALAVSLSEKACVDMAYMKALSGKSVAALVQALTGSIFEEPMPERGQSERQYEPHYVSADAYLSGNVREKLKAAIVASRVSDRFKPNIEALEKAQPKDLMASEITVRLGATWIPEKDIEVFMFDLLSTPRYMIWNIHVHFLPFNAEWHIEGKNRDNANLKVSSTYGTTRKNAYQIIEETLNLKDVKIFDYREDAEGKKKAVLNRKETTIAQEKQEQIKAAFKEWVWEDPERRARITAYYNDHFNAIRPREYDGSVLNFYGMNPEIALRPHQKNAVARIIYGGNTLLAHVVGSGKTFTMITAAMEMKRIGLCQKSMVVIPNHIISQFAAEWMLLYPSANILVTSKKDFETKKRQKFCAKIATGDYDGVIIGHSQFGKIPLSTKRQQLFLKRQIDEITDSIVEAKRQQGERFTIKQMEKTRKTLEMRMEKLNDQRQKDDVVTFEQLGIDRLFVDEADEFKNLYLYTKMRNVGGIAQTEAQKSSDLFMKTQYIDELTGGKGTIFATGTPISNSMVELYTLQRYLQYDVLKKAGLQHFDAWASTFGETVSAIELAPEGTGYRMKTRFAHFYNLPELMTLFKEVADIQTADQLALPVPKVNYQVIKTNPSTFQKEMVENLAERAEAIRKSAVDPAVDNMLCITNDGRKLALDQRLSNAQLPDDLGSKVNACIEKAYQFWWDGKDEKLTQILFCDLSTPKKDAGFNVYDDIRDKLVKRGIPLEEIRFIHEADSEIKKKELFGKVRKGSVRILLGSTAKLGAGTNIQDRLIALHDLDCPWRPRDLEQRAGRIVRQGNRNPEVNILRYVTEGTFDSYSYQLIENKQRFIAQIMTSKTPVRSAEDIDASVLSYAEIKALATGNPLIKEKMDLDISVSQLQLLKQSYLSQKYDLEDKILKYYPQRIIGLREKVAGISVDIQVVKDNEKSDKQAAMTLLGVTYNERSEAGKALLHICKTMTSPEKVDIGHYRGFDMALEYKKTAGCFRIILKHTFSYSVELGASAHGNIERIDHRLDGLKVKLNDIQLELETLKKQCETAKIEVQKPFTKEEELVDKMARLNVLNASLNHDEKDSQLIDAEPEATQGTLGFDADP